MAAKLKQRDYTPQAKGTLEGVRVLDLSRLFAGNLLTQVLGDFGAEVIKVKPRTGSRSTNTAPRNVYRCKDGRYVGLSASTQKMAERTFRAIGRADLVNDPRYRTNAGRVKRAGELDAIIGAFVARRTQAGNVKFFDQAEVTIGPIYDIAQIVEDPHILERELLADYPDADMGRFPMHHVAPRLLGTPGSIRTPAPKLGEHNRMLLSELKIDEVQYEKFLKAGVVAEGAALKAEAEK